jgi:molybdopterin-binding protein
LGIGTADRRSSARLRLAQYVGSHLRKQENVMDSYYVLKNIHKVGHIISGEVIGYEKTIQNGYVFHQVELKTNSDYKAIITNWENDSLNDFNIPKIGSKIDAVIKNHSDDVLYLSIHQSDFQKIKEYQDFYEFIENINEREILKGKVVKVTPCGLFINLGWPYLGLIDIGHISFNKGKQLPLNFIHQIHEGDMIQSIISYFRFDNKQIGLGWYPSDEK